MAESYLGIPELQYHYCGEWSDPQLVYHGIYYNFYDCEEAWRGLFEEDVRAGEIAGITEKMLCADNQEPVESAYEKWLQENKELVKCEMDETETTYGYTPEIREAIDELEDIKDNIDFEQTNFIESKDEILCFDLLIKHGLIDNDLKPTTAMVHEGDQFVEKQVEALPIVIIKEGMYYDNPSDIIDVAEHFEEYLKNNPEMLEEFREYLHSKEGISWETFQELDVAKDTIVAEYLGYCEDRVVEELAEATGQIKLDELCEQNAEAFDNILRVAEYRHGELLKKDNTTYREKYHKKLTKTNKLNSDPVGRNSRTVIENNNKELKTERKR